MEKSDKPEVISFYKMLKYSCLSFFSVGGEVSQMKLEEKFLLPKECNLYCLFPADS